MRVLVVSLINLAVLCSPASAADPLPGPTAIKAKSPLIQGKQGKRGKRREQKETEGSEAPDRFEADTILKSVYHDRGQPLEVDPD